MGEKNNLLLAVGLVTAMSVGALAGTFLQKPMVLAEESKEVWNRETFHGNLTNFQGGLDLSLIHI